jgi:hypothetical protein
LKNGPISLIYTDQGDSIMKKIVNPGGGSGGGG